LLQSFAVLFQHLTMFGKCDLFLLQQGQCFVQLACQFLSSPLQFDNFFTHSSIAQPQFIVLPELIQIRFGVGRGP